MEASLRTVHLYGELAETCQPKLRLAVHTPTEAVRAILTNFPSSLRPIREGEFYVIRGDTLDNGWSIGEDFIKFGLGKDDLHIVPVASGAIFGGGQGSKGTLKIILGAALIAGAIAFAPGGVAGLSAVAFEVGAIGVTYGNIALFGAAMLFGGISYLLAPTPDKVSSDERGEQPISHVYRGPVNTVQQGNPVPVVYGQMRVGSQVVSVGIENTMPSGSPAASSPAATARNSSPPDRLSARLESSAGPVILSWQETSGAEGYQYRFRRFDHDSDFEDPHPWTSWNTVSGTNTEVEIAASNFRRPRRYEFQVRAFFALEGSTPSDFGSSSSSVILTYGFVGTDANQYFGDGP